MASTSPHSPELLPNRRYVAIELYSEPGKPCQGYGVAIAEFTGSALAGALRPTLKGKLCLKNNSGEEKVFQSRPIAPTLIIEDPNQDSVRRAVKSTVMDGNAIPSVYGEYWAGLSAIYIIQPTTPTVAQPLLSLVQDWTDYTFQVRISASIVKVPWGS